MEEAERKFGAKIVAPIGRVLHAVANAEIGSLKYHY